MNQHQPKLLTQHRKHTAVIRTSLFGGRHASSESHVSRIKESSPELLLLVSNSQIPLTHSERQPISTGQSTQEKQSPPK